MIASYQVLDRANTKHKNYEYLRRFSTKRPEVTFAEGPQGLAIDQKAGHIFIANTHYHQIMIFQNNGEHIRNFGQQGFDDGDFFLPVALQFDFYGNLVICDKGNNRIQVFDHQHRFKSKIEGTQSPSDLAIDNDGNYVVCEYWRGQILIFNSSSGALMKTFCSQGKDPGQLKQPLGIAVNLQGHIIVADSENHRIQIFSSTGDLIRCFGEEGRSLSQFTRPSGIAVDLHGNLFVSDSGNNRILIFTPEGEFIKKLGADERMNFMEQQPGRMGSPYHPVLDPKTGNLLVCDAAPFCFVHIFG